MKVALCTMTPWLWAMFFFARLNALVIVTQFCICRRIPQGTIVTAKAYQDGIRRRQFQNPIESLRTIAKPNVPSVFEPDAERECAGFWFRSGGRRRR